MPNLQIRAVIKGRGVDREEVLAWEARRLPKAARRIGLPRPTGSLAEQRLAFADAKLALGDGEIRRRLARYMRWADAITHTSARALPGRRTSSVCDLYASGGDAASFVTWFTDATRSDYSRSMIAANPDHFLIGTAADGRLEVIETTGGSPLTSRFLIDVEDLATLTTPLDPTFTAEISGVARTNAGIAIGGVRHQFRNTEDGFHAHLLVEFPRAMPPHMISQHRWHLAAEFSNWIEFAFASNG